VGRRPVARRAIRSPSRFAGARRQPTNWSRITEALRVTVPAASKVLMHNLVLSNSGISEVVRRTRGVLNVSSDQAATQEFVSGALGAMVATDTAIAAGIASLPDPVTDQDDDGWLLWMPFMGLLQGVQGTTGVDLMPTSLNFEFDSKAMRKVEEGYGVIFVVANATAGFGMSVALSISVLTSRP